MEIETTIQVRRSVKERFAGLKRHPRESFESVIVRLIGMTTDDEPLSAEEIRDIKRSLKEIEQGKIHTLAEVEKGLGIK